MPAAEIEAGRAAPILRRWYLRLRRLVRAFLITNLALAVVIISLAAVAHRWASNSPENFEQAIGHATQYVLTPANMIDAYGMPPASLDHLVRVIEVLVIESAGWTRERPAHRYWQGRLLMAMPAVYKRLGRTQERLDRGARAVGIFAALSASQPSNVDFRRRLAVSHGLHGADLADLGRHDDAIAHWRAQQIIARQLLAEQPDHWRWQWYQAGADLNIASSQIAAGRAGLAVAFLEASAAVARPLCVTAPGEMRQTMCDLVRRGERLLAESAVNNG